MAEWQRPETIAVWIGITLLIAALLGTAVVVLVQLHLKRMLGAQEAYAQAQLDHQKELLHASVMVQERERTRIASDLHDELIGKLNLLALLGDAPKASVDPRALLKESIGIARRISHDLSPPLLEATGLPELLDELLAPMRTRYEVTLRTSLYTAIEPSTPTKLQLMRIVQELLSNVVKHANASSINLYLRASTTGLAILFIDNGKGFNAANASGGLGMRNIELRVQLLAGQYHFKPASTGGSRFCMMIPHATPLQHA